MRAPIILAFLIALSPALPTHAASIETFSAQEPMALELLTCGYWLARPQDFHRIDEDDAPLIYLNDGSSGLIRIDGKFIRLESADSDGRGTYRSADGTVFLEPHFNIGELVGVELSIVTGRIDVTHRGKLQKVAVKGYMGC